MRRAAALAMAGGALVLAIVAVWLWRQASQERPQTSGLRPQASDIRRAPADAVPEPEARGLRPEASPGPKPDAPPRPTADASRRATAAALLATLRSSGPAHEPWEDQARTLLGALAQGEVDATYAGCFVAGCAATIVFPTRAAYDRVAADGGAFPGWTGGRQWSDPDATEDGRITAVVVLYRPD